MQKLALEVTWHHFPYILLVQAVTKICPQSKGGTWTPLNERNVKVKLQDTISM